MPTITEIKPQKSKKRVNIYLDESFSARGGPASSWGFGLDLENFVRLGLKVGMELTEEEVTEIVRKAEFSKTFDKMIRFGMMRPRSEKEFRDWLRKYKVHESIYDELFSKLKRLELLDDERFAKWWVSSRNEFKPRSKSALTFELLKKGIARDLIKDVLSDIQIDEVSLAKEVVMKKKRVWEKLEKQEAKRKIQMILAARGFGWEVAKKVTEDVLSQSSS
jgi:regulatory protein